MNTHQPESSRGSAGEGRKNIQSACDACKKRKKRCDGVKPVCGLCANLNSDCVYSERRVRGPGKSKDYILMLEERLKKVESSINSGNLHPGSLHAGSVHAGSVHSSSLNSSSSASSPPSPAQESSTPFHQQQQQQQIHPIDLPVTAVADLRPGHTERGGGYVGGQSALDPSVRGATSPLFTSPPSHQSSVAVSLLYGLDSTAGLVQDPTPTATAAAASQQHAAAPFSSQAFPRIVFVPLPPQFNVTRVIQSTWDTLAPHNLLFTLNDVLSLVGQQYALAGPDAYGDSPARWAIVNSLVATTVLHKVTNDFLGNVAQLSWNFFKNAFAMFAELVTQGSDVTACEALLTMALFTRASADARTTRQLVTAATSLVYSLGLHRQEFYHCAELPVITRGRRVFWMTRWLDAEMAHKYGAPLSLGDVDSSSAPVVAHLAYSASEDRSADYLEKMAQLSSIQARVDRLLHSAKTLDAGIDLVQRLLDLEDDCRAWRGTLPVEFQLPIDLPQPVTARVAMVHLNYYSTRINTFMVIARLRRPSPERISQIMKFRTSSADATIENFWDRCTAAARDLIELSLSIPTDCLSTLWEMLAYPLSAFLLLFCSMLDGQMSTNAQANLAANTAFVGLLERLRGAGCDIVRLLMLCAKLNQVSSMTVESDIPPENMHCMKDFHQKLAGVDDWLQLAQGLMSNMPGLRAWTEEVFGSIILLFLHEPMDGMYGACVPDVLKSQRQNFRFGP